jgi:hypothetical protein
MSLSAEDEVGGHGGGEDRIEAEDHDADEGGRINVTDEDMR